MLFPLKHQFRGGEGFVQRYDIMDTPFFTGLPKMPIWSIIRVDQKNNLVFMGFWGVKSTQNTKESEEIQQIM